MAESITGYFKKTYKVAGVISFVIIFFVTYNAYLVDRSIINLRLALNQAVEAKSFQDFEKIKPLLKIPLLQEISKKTLVADELVPIEIAENITATAKGLEQVEDIKFFLKTAIKSKERERGAFLTFLDRLNTNLFGAQTQAPKMGLINQSKSVLTKIKSTQDKNQLQSLYLELGNIHMQLSDLDKAEAAFMKAIEIVPSSKLALKAKFNLAWAYKTMGKPQQAITLFAEVNRDYVLEGQYEIADSLYKGGDYQASRDKYAQLSTEYPQFSLADIALYEAGYISMYQLGDKEVAASYFSKLENKFPESKLFKHTLDEVRPVLAKTYRDQGYQLLREKQYEQAIAKFQKAVEFFPLDGTSLTGMGLGLYWMDRKQDALDKAKSALETSRDDEVCFTNYLFICVNSGLIDEAIRVGEAILLKRKIRAPEFYYNLGNAYIAKDRIDSAVIQYDRAIRLNPDFVFALNNLGCAFWAVGKYSEAIQMFKRAIDREPDYPDSHFNLGITSFYSNQFNEAYAEFKKVLAVAPDYKGAKSYLDRTTQALGYQP